MWKFLADNWFLLLTGLGLGWYTSSVLIHAFTVFDGAETLFKRFRAAGRLPAPSPPRPQARPRR